MRPVQITRFGGPEVMDVVDLPDPVPGDGERLFDISSSGVNFADTHQALSREAAQCLPVRVVTRRLVNGGWSRRSTRGASSVGFVTDGGRAAGVA